ncbi:MAG: tetratricopeptide repeat protein [Planctomycetota bacterium]|jgi:tetratricopeptide (TPR) repeat protein
MYKLPVILTATVCLTAAAVGRADSIKKTDGQIIGSVTATTATEVSIRPQNGAPVKVPVNEIESILFSDEPSRLKTARLAIQAGRYEDAVTGLKTINLDTVKKPQIKQDVQFYLALAEARIALTGADPDAIRNAGTLMFGFVENNATSYHYLEACEVLGDLLVAIGQHAQAQKYYSEIEQAPWPEYKMRAGVAVGRALLAEGKAGDALKSFQAVLDTKSTAASAGHQRLAATLGKARCLAEAGQGDEAVKLVEEVVAKANPEEVELHAQAYNALGIAHAKAGRTQDALLAFLHVDVLYFTASKEHIEALQNLVTLWRQVQKPERANEAVRILQEQYKRSADSN